MSQEFSRSIRYFSTGSKGTTVSVGSGIVSNESTPLINGVRANEILLSYMKDLPTRSWIGKVMWDCVLKDADKDKRGVRLAEKIWNRLITMEHLAIDVNYQLLSPEGERHKSRVLSQSLRRSWQNLDRLLLRNFVEFVGQNPASLNSSLLTPEKVIHMSLVKSLLDPRSREKWETFLALSDEGVETEDPKHQVRYTKTL
nr:hypothetical protein [Plasmopara viticola lesion associated mononegaambi virus 7]